MKEYKFLSAMPIWEEGKEKEKNYNLIFRAFAPKGENTVVCLSASNLYQMFVNGIMMAQGPARCGHGVYRTDEIDITEYLTKEKNIVCIYVNCGYIKNFYQIKQPAFLCAEIVQNGKVISATGVDGFEAKYHSERLRYVSRYSPMRTFSEVYRLDTDYRSFEYDENCNFAPVKLCTTESKKFIHRDVPYPCYDEYFAPYTTAKGTFTYEDSEEYNMIDWVEYGGNPDDPGFARKDCECVILDEADKCKCTLKDSSTEKATDVELKSMEWSIFDMQKEKTGFIMLDITCEEDAEIILTFDELLTDGDVKFRLNITNGVIWYLKKGTYSLISNEPSSMRYIKIANNSKGTTTIRKTGIKEYAFNITAPSLNSSNPKLNAIYDASIETFRQNTVDIYMDCPSRERAGYLCDSYFTAKTEFMLTGKSTVEKNHLENHLISEGFEDVPDDMFAMCYPSDFPKKEIYQFIPNWAMWYVIELEEYLERTGDRELVDMAKEKIYKLYRYFEKFKNSDGLLEKLEKWVFIEWSKAADFVQDVSYPTNMLYARMLRSMGKLYDSKFITEAEAVENTIRSQSYFDGFFHDHAIRNEDGSLTVVKEDISETCQYYAFFTGTATRELYPELWSIMLNDFGPQREETKKWEHIHTSAAFIGNCLRLYLLDIYGEKETLLSNIEGYYYDMATATNTLWEEMTPTASCNHGFASVISVWLKKYAE